MQPTYRGLPYQAFPPILPIMPAEGLGPGRGMHRQALSGQARPQSLGLGLPHRGGRYSH
ncbi:hypothetical protein XM38_001440 [Halomicronema hongdechloris C2206]|uniref:Uncharacterized protein n=1 Tax=Halomicronema hongdechloris C2206 TaxID=1641165 RepID=A0A1Z3HFZ4_9CYAN|nr:hypothetical protein [Halomicronema hongdechloris]ASC69218.1 hypothetical protein XM38_001440 [Halomicronema hongdechloris C2206]